MSPWVLLTLFALLLVYPWILMPAGRRDSEVRGPLRALLWNLNVLYCRALHRLVSNGPAPLPERGPAILIANHTCNIDPMLLQAGCRRVLGFMIAKEFYEYWAFRPICRLLGCIPVRRDGRDLAATRAALRALEEGRVVPLFPEGRINPTSGRELGEGKPGAAFLVLHARVPVVPAYICGTPETNNVWRALVTRSRARVVYGPPIDLSEFIAQRPTDRETLAALTARLMDAIGALRDRAAELDNPDGPHAVSNPVPDVPVDPRRAASSPGAVPGDRPAALRP
jgi:1-acyl-sn-glycerol-3-phosphate acyltransferase